jgi:hypothetical protein
VQLARVSRIEMKSRPYSGLSGTQVELVFTACFERGPGYSFALSVTGVLD